MAELTRAERLAAARRKAQREARQKAEFGRDAGDKALGIISGLGFGAYGAGSDLMGGISSLLGFDEFGADQELRSDEAYQRASNYFKLGLDEGGRQGIKDSTFPLVSSSVFGPGTDEMRDAIIAQDNLKNQQAILEEENDSLLFDIDIPDKFSNESPITMGRDFELGALSRPTPKELSEQENLIGEGLPNTSNDFFEQEKKLQELKELSNNERLQMSGMPEINEEAVNDAYIAAMKDFNNSAGKKDIPVKNETKADALERYKKEFTDATGIDASGKVDKSKALMAFGLALMQNKAGKGFNVGKMLQSVGSAGEAAQPMLNKAIDQARASKVAAGKYALDQVKAGESAAAAYAKEVRESNREFILKQMEIDAAAAKAKEKGIEYKNVESNEPVDGLKIHYGAFNGQSVLAKPVANAPMLVTTFNGYTKAQEMLNQMSSDLESVAAQDTPTFSKAIDAINSRLVGFGLKDAKVTFGETGVSPLKRVERARQTIINEYKRALLQESQVSDLDLETLFMSLGEQGIFDNPNEAVMAIDNMKGYFGSKKNKILPIFEQFRDPYMYRNKNEYEKVQEIFSESLEGKYRVTSSQNGENPSIDLTANNKGD